MTEKPTHKAIHICNSHQPTLKPKIAKEYVFANADKQKKEHRTHNKVLPKWRVKYFYESFLQISTLEYLLNFSAKNPPLRQYPNRYRSG